MFIDQTKKKQKNKKRNAPLEPSHGAAVLRIEALAHPKAATIPGHALDPAST